ncbi:uncharacterized protein LOC135336873 [Halichondria panicea]|uniref:uncharacterized protein LOC135336873 n=1 Tax=Halichondria panicea TaxID=6063 RepID=UPI00312BB084
MIPLVLLVLMGALSVNCQSLTCLAEEIPAGSDEFQRCLRIILNATIGGSDAFCSDSDCKTFFSDAYNNCGLCNPIELGCSTSLNLTDNNGAPALSCLFNDVAAHPNLQECQRRRSQNLTDYCLADDCYFIENGYNTCGFDIHKCNPVRQACNAHFMGALQECNSAVTAGPTFLTAIMVMFYYFLQDF